MKNIGASVSEVLTNEKNKEYEEQTTQYMPENIEEIHISHAMCTYTVSFYAIGEQAIF